MVLLLQCQPQEQLQRHNLFIDVNFDSSIVQINDDTHLLKKCATLATTYIEIDFYAPKKIS